MFLFFELKLKLEEASLFGFNFFINLIFSFIRK